jgi:uncharacterized iron-regulated protein
MLTRAFRVIGILLPFTLMAQTVLPAARPLTPEAHYRAYDAQGRAVKLEEIVAALDGADVLFVGETHNDPFAHLLEAELLRRAAERFARGASGAARPVALSLEMFERDVQLILDEYLAGLIAERHFLLSSRPWPNYQTDYRPLVEYAKGRGLPVIAANAPARYVSRVTANGPKSLEALSETARAWLPPLPFAPASEAYAAKFRAFMHSAAARATPHSQPPNPHANPPANPHAAPNPHGAHGGGAGAPVFLLEAQTLRDAAMADAISDHLQRHARALVVHVNGTFHSERGLGVPEHLKAYRPKARALVVTIVSDEGFPDFDAARHAGLGDFVILTDPSGPRSS